MGGLLESSSSGNDRFRLGRDGFSSMARHRLRYGYAQLATSSVFVSDF